METPVLAAGTTQAAATALAYRKTIRMVTSSTAGSAEGVKLPSSGTGKLHKVKNASANTIQCYPQAGFTIDGGATNAPVAIADGKTRTFCTTTSNIWQSEISA